MITKTIDLGTVGETYPIVEPDVVEELLQAAADHGIKNNPPFSRLVKSYQPANLHTLPSTTENRTFLVDVNYTLDRDLLDATGKVIYPQGYTFNPLDYISFPGGLVVINGAEPLQVEWFKKSPYADNHGARLLLSDGFAFDLVRKLKRPVFYLTGDIAKKLQLSAAPSIVVQKEHQMLVQEIVIPQDKQGALDDKE